MCTYFVDEVVVLYLGECTESGIQVLVPECSRGCEIDGLRPIIFFCFRYVSRVDEQF